MTVSRRDFMKLFGISVASLLLARCKPFVSCYTPQPPTCYAPTAPPASARERLRHCWLRFGELAQATLEEANQGSTENALGQQLSSEHRAALDELVVTGELTQPVADLVQEAYDAALYHVWRSNAPMTCYEPMIVNYAPVSAQVLVQQSEALSEIASQGTIDPGTLENARAALEHDMAFYALTDDEVTALYNRIVTESPAGGGSAPDFGNVNLEITPEAEAAARFLIDVLSGK
jgi:DNA-binding transcriptional regulator PaaX